MTNKPTLTHNHLRRFTGDLERFRHWIARSVIFTPGVKHVAERAGAYWLIDELVFAITGNAIQRAGRTDPRVLEMHFWRLEVDGGSATLFARADSDADPFYRKVIQYTDFPLDHIEIWAAFDGEHWTLYLPSEH